MGPVPVSLQDEINEEGEELTNRFSIEKIPFAGDKERVEFTPKFDIELDCFTRREIRLLEELIAEFKTAKSQDMIDATHMENDPWRVW
jgi:acyl-ACP thioesterase